MTGYVHEMVDKNMDFPQFAMLCSRAFGALIMMRDDAMGAPIPDAIEPEPYHRDKIVESQAELARLNAMSNDERITFGKNKKRKELTGLREGMASNNATNEKLSAMLAKVRTWTPPTLDHANMKKFMVDQLTSSMSKNTFYVEAIASLESKAPVDLYAEAVKGAERDVAYHEKEWQDEVKRAADRTAWVRALKRSLAAEAPASAG